MPITFKVADRLEEFEQIHALNFRTFVDEIPQHAPLEGGRLVDRFDAENTYLIALRGGSLIGMSAVRSVRPFSLDGKLDDVDGHLPPHASPCEVRLLAVERCERGGRVLVGLMDELYRHFLERGHDLALISGTTRQERLYARLGFTPFGPLVGTGEASFQPMYLTLAAAERHARPFMRLAPSRSPLCFLPGPVPLADGVRRALAGEPVSHRSASFREDIDAVAARLRQLTGARRVWATAGSGTLANDVVAAHLEGRGAVVASGEFGERLCDHARRAGLAFDVLRRPRGHVVSPAEIDHMLGESAAAWLWLAHCETSTGALHDLAAISRVCAARGVRLALDAISSIGLVPADLRGVQLASATSGKGLAGIAGIAFVLQGGAPVRASRPLPRSLDLALGSVPFTLSSNLLAAVRVALELPQGDARFKAIAETAEGLRERLRDLGLEPLVGDSGSSPAVTTIELATQSSSRQIGERLRERGVHVSFESGYLLERNALQLCLMGELPGDAELDRAIGELRLALGTGARIAV